MIAGISCVTIFLIDFVITTVSMMNLNKKCKEIYDYIDKSLDAKFDKITDKSVSRFLDENLRFDKKTDLQISLAGISKKFRENETHFLRAFPSFKSTKYSALIDKIRIAYKKRKN